MAETCHHSVRRFNRPQRDEGSFKGIIRRWKRRAIFRHTLTPPDARSHFAENLNTVFDLNVSPGFKIVLGKSGWFGESGKCCVSRQKP